MSNWFRDFDRAAQNPYFRQQFIALHNQIMNEDDQPAPQRRIQNEQQYSDIDSDIDNSNDDYERQQRERERDEEVERIERGREEDRRRYELQLQESARQQAIAREAQAAAERRAEEEQRQRQAAERKVKEEQRQREENDLKSRMEMQYIQLKDIYISSINRLNILLDNKYNNKYIINYNKLKLENDRLNEYHIDIILDPSISQLVLIGATGHGKSTFGNRLSGIDNSEYGDIGPFKTEHATTDSITDRIKKHTCINNNNKISIIDTPGIYDSFGNDNFHLNKVIQYLRGTNGISAFIIVCRAGKFDTTYQEMLKDLESMLTPQFWSNVIFVVTFVQDQIAANWYGWKQNFYRNLNRRLNLQNNILKEYQIIGVNNNDRNSYCLCINSLLNIMNDRNKFNKKRFICKNLESPIDKLKQNTLNIGNEIKSLILKRDNEKSNILNCKQTLSQLINECENKCINIDSKYSNCLNTIDEIVNNINTSNNNKYIIHDLSNIACINNNNGDNGDNGDNDEKYQQQLYDNQLNNMQSRFQQLEMEQQTISSLNNNFNFNSSSSPLSQEKEIKIAQVTAMGFNLGRMNIINALQNNQWNVQQTIIQLCNQ